MASTSLLSQLLLVKSRFNISIHNHCNHDMDGKDVDDDDLDMDNVDEDDVDDNDDAHADSDDHNNEVQFPIILSGARGERLIKIVWMKMTWMTMTMSNVHAHCHDNARRFPIILIRK